ncbi:MAG: Crp/Fnr family transcriptional regulator [Gemmatimonadota bacterium]|nr:MAG: Crp/Fnr family transcriptional regulator [Gemmatimonadota bacterium]
MHVAAGTLIDGWPRSISGIDMQYTGPQSWHQADQLEDDLDTLAALSGIDGAALQELAPLALCHTYPKNNYLFYQGDPVESVFIVLDGKVKLTMTNEEGREIVLTFVEPGGSFGIVAALDGGGQVGNAVTTTPCRLAKIEAKAWVRWLYRHPATLGVILEQVCVRSREVCERLAQQVLMDVKDRLFHALLTIAESEGECDCGGDSVSFTRPTHQELAIQIGSSREVVSRALRQILEESDLEEEGRRIRVRGSWLRAPRTG